MHASNHGWEPESGLAALYDCPDCEWKRTGATTSRHGFKTHLITEHGYEIDAVAKLLGGD